VCIGGESNWAKLGKHNLSVVFEKTRREKSNENADRDARLELMRYVANSRLGRGGRTTRVGEKNINAISTGLTCCPKSVFPGDATVASKRKLQQERQGRPHFRDKGTKEKGRRKKKTNGLKRRKPGTTGEGAGGCERRVEPTFLKHGPILGEAGSRGPRTIAERKSPTMTPPSARGKARELEANSKSRGRMRKKKTSWVKMSLCKGGNRNGPLLFLICKNPTLIR